ncbi:hypothetical protein BKA70DRAFT_1394478 [Coprinopsis sp. MPI-PUGE-AT-0042]|nr:hypothetical protein BKA70DRAFT_1394478 [Coprinopsis sp. MPI-PUGE-AT-0042]
MQAARLLLLAAFSLSSVLGRLASIMSTPVLDKKGSNSRWTYYNVEVGLGACGTPLRNSDFVVALSHGDFGQGFPGRHCGKAITLRYGGKSTRAKIMDDCQSCPKEGLDLSPSLHEFFSPLSNGIIYGEWEFA